MREYGVSTAIGDRYGAEWVSSAFSKLGVRYEVSERDRSQIYLDMLPLFTSGRARLLDNSRLITQFAGLERRTSPMGKDRVDHGKGGFDDACNAASLAMVLAAGTGNFDLFNFFLAWGDYPDRHQMSLMSPEDRARWIEKIHADMRGN